MIEFSSFQLVQSDRNRKSNSLEKLTKTCNKVIGRAPLPTLNFIYYDRWSIDWLIDCLDWLIDWLIDSLTDRLIDWVIDCLQSSCCGAIYPFSLVLKLLSHLTRTPETKENTVKPIECFHMTSQRPYCCPKTMKRRPCWCPKPVLWELNSFLMQTLSFVPVILHRCWPRERKYPIFSGLNSKRTPCIKRTNSSVSFRRFFPYFK